MAHPYAKYSQQKVGHDRARSFVQKRDGGGKVLQGPTGGKGAPGVDAIMQGIQESAPINSKSNIRLMVPPIRIPITSGGKAKGGAAYARGGKVKNKPKVEININSSPKVGNHPPPLPPALATGTPGPAPMLPKVAGGAPLKSGGRVKRSDGGRTIKADLGMAELGRRTYDATANEGVDPKRRVGPFPRNISEKRTLGGMAKDYKSGGKIGGADSAMGRLRMTNKLKAKRG